MAIQSVAVLFDNTDRPETTGVYVRRALGELVEVDHYLPKALHELRKQAYDLYLQVDDGHDVVLPEKLRPIAFWAIDTHMDLERYQRIGRRYDWVFTAQRDGAEALQKMGIQASWLPLACDPFFHRRHEVPKEWDLAFIGNMVSGARADLVYFLKQQFPNILIDQRYFAEMAKAYSAARIVFNRSIKNDINMRVFEATACGSLLMTNGLQCNGMADLFKDGVHLATYQSPDELIDKVRFYLANESSREKIATDGMAHAYQHHTYRHRVEQILQAAESCPTRVSMAKSATPASDTFKSDSFYYGYVRQDILDLISSDAKRILDIGCGAGRLGEALKLRQNATVVGIETVPAAASQARLRLDQVFEDDIESLDLSAEPQFDVVVCADVLEHLKNPLQVLRKVVTWLQPNGTLVVSIPNARHHTVVRGLLEGHWTYEPAGLLDETHLRFFTRREIEKMLYRAGFHIQKRDMTTGAEHADWLRGGCKGEVKLGRLFVGGLTPEDAEEFHVYQYLFTAQPRLTIDYGMTSIILVTHNGLTDTRECISSLMQLTDHPFELICIDNGSSDGTPDYLETLAYTKVVRNPGNRGFPAAVNQGLKLATGKQILLLNNDTVLTTGWLTRLLQALYSEERMGLVGPVSNCAPGDQRIQDIPYGPDLIGMDGFAWDIASRNAGKHLLTPTLSGFCLLFRREVYEQLGLLDERFGIGTMEDDDYCHRAAQAGWKVAVAQDVYIHHTGHRTFQQIGIDFDALAEQNRAQFNQKWSTPTVTRARTLTSIVIPVHGQLQHTRRCLESIRRHTPQPIELILIDNASPDDTAEWLKQQHDITVISNPINKGFPAAVNQGLRMAQGAQLLILNNDTVVVSGWLDHMIEALNSSTTVGMVGPCTNRISGEQQVAVSYDEESLSGLEEFAASWDKTHDRRYEPTDRLVGFCMLIKREVIGKLGYLDEQFGLGNFEDDDYCQRAIQAGYQLLIARDAFIHHVGHATFQGAGVDFQGLMERNHALFLQKWQASSTEVSLVQPPAEYELADTGNSDHILLQRKHIRGSLCMIVKNNERFIVECLTSIRPYVDEMIVLDTGSTDRTAELAQSVGARVYHFPWCDSFSAARNESLKYARGQWIFWMDSDDVISPECGMKLRLLTYQEHPANIMGFMMQVHCIGPGPEGHQNVTKVDHVKLFRNHPQLRFEFRMHEQIMMPIRRLGGEIVWTDLFVTHANYDHTPQGQKHKLERDLKLLHLDEVEHPDHTFVLFNLGMTYEAHDPARAVGYLERSIQTGSPGESHLRKVFAYLTSAYSRLNQLDKALDAVERGLQQFSMDEELRYRRANLLSELGKYQEAVAAYQHLLSEREDRHITSVMQGLSSHMARAQLANTYSSMGKHSEALTQWIQVTNDAPWFRTGWRGCVETLLKQGQHQQAADLVQAAQPLRQLPGESEHLIANIHVAISDLPRASYWYEQAVEQAPQDEVILERVARFYFESGPAQQARPYLERLIALNPKDAAALHNLGAVHLDAKEYSRARECLRQSLAVRPDAKQTQDLLAVVESRI